MNRITKRLPPDFKKSRYLQGIGESSEKEFDRLIGMSEKVTANATTDNADDDGLKVLMKDYVIETVGETREVIVSRIKAKKRGVQATTKHRLLEVIRAWDSEADIVEHIADYSFEVILHKANIHDAVREIIDDLKPAHLATHYQVKQQMPSNALVFGGSIYATGYLKITMQNYQTYGEVKSTTYRELKGRTYSQVLYGEV